ncbi:SH3 domain-containing protein, partial [Streptomyces sp. SID7499]|nr:SH3 domain-containing protein [Streptomyces sp. SID7499]
RPSRLRRLGLCVATGTLAALTAAAPVAMAADPQPVGQRAEAAAPDPTSDELSASALQREHEAQQKQAREEAQKQGQAKPQAPK